MVVVRGGWTYQSYGHGTKWNPGAENHGLQVIHIEEEKEGAPPMEFEVLLEQLIPPGELKKAIQKLLTAKRAGNELQTGPRIEPVSNFIQQELKRLQQKKPDKEPNTDVESINTLFRGLLTHQ